MARKNAELRSEVAKAVMDEVQRVGPEFDRAAIVTRFLGKGADRATIFRWIAAEMASGRPAQAVAKRVKKAAAKRAADRRTRPPTQLGRWSRNCQRGFPRAS